MIETLKAFQGLVGTAIAFTTAVIIAPRIAERYARAREYWTRRIDLAKAVGDFAVRYWNLPEAPLRLLDASDPVFRSALEEAVRLRNESRLLNGDELADALFMLLHQSLLLPHKERYTYWHALRQFIESETRRDLLHARLGMLAAILQLGPAIEARIRQAEATIPPSERTHSANAIKWQGTIAMKFISTMRKYSIWRPWTWLPWWRWERQMREVRAKGPFSRNNPEAGRLTAYHGRMAR